MAIMLLCDFTTAGPESKSPYVPEVAAVAAERAPVEATAVALAAPAPKQHKKKINTTKRMEITMIHISALKPELPFWTTTIWGCC